MAAAIYAARYKLKTAIISKMMGGAMTEANIIENYPGYLKITGLELATKMREQVENLKVPIIEEEVIRAEHLQGHFRINQKHESKYLVLALGTERTKLNVMNEDRYIGRGLSYCATCDAPFFKDKVVGVVGGRNSAVMAAELLTNYAKKVYVIYRGESLQAQPLQVERLLKNPKVKPIYACCVTHLEGEKMLSSVKLDTGAELELEGLFVEIGSTPSTVIARELGVKLDEQGYIIVDQKQRTNKEHIYAAGDITTNSAKWRQIIMACAEGSLAARSIYEAKKDAD